jgi:glutamate 5-kinase
VLVTSADLVEQALSGDDIGTWFAPNPETPPRTGTTPLPTVARSDPAAHVGGRGTAR